MPARPQRLRAYLYLLISTLFWGASFIVVEPALDVISPYQFLFYRFLLASILIAPVLYPYFKQARYRAMIWNIVWIEVIGSVLYMILLYEGLARSTAIETSLLATTTPLFIIIASILLLRERQTRREWLGWGLSFGGMLVIAVLPLLNGSVGFSRLSLIGNGLILAANTTEALWAVLIKHYYKKIPMIFAVGISFWVGAVAFSLMSFINANYSLATLTRTMLQDWQHPSVAIAVLYMVIFSSIIALTFYLKGQKLIEASEAGLFFYLQPLVYLPLGIWLLNEPLSPYQVVGLLLVLAGVGISELRR